MSTVVIYSYGVGEFAQQVFNAVAAVINSGSFTRVMQGLFFIAGITAAVQFTQTRRVSDLMMSILRYIVVMSLLVLPQTRVLVKDDVMRTHYTVDHVPIGLALPASLTTSFFHGLTEWIETTFHWPDDLSYSKTGYLFASQIVQNTGQFQITDPEFSRSVKSYLEQCMFYDIYLERYSLKELLQAEDIWAFVSARASVNRAFLLNGVVTVCKEGVVALNKQWEQVMEDSGLRYSRLVFPGMKHKTPVELKALFYSHIATGFHYLTGMSSDAHQILQQNLMINALKDTALNNPELGMLSYAVTRANAQKSAANTTIGLMMTRWLPPMMGAVECLMYAMFILVVMYCLFTQGEKTFLNYVLSLVWIGSWPVVYALMNFGFIWAIRLRSAGHTLSFYDSGHLSQVQYDMSSLFGYFTLLVPYVAWGMMNLSKQGMGSVFTQMSQLVGGSVQSLGGAASGEALSGNFNFGNTSFGNHSLNNTHGFKQDTNLSYMSGSLSTSLPSGSTITEFVDGHGAVNMDPALSRLNTNVHLSSSQRTASSIQAESSLSAAMTDSSAITENLSSAVRNLYDVGTHIHQSTSSGEQYGVTVSGGYADSVSKLTADIDKYAQDNNVSVQDAIKKLVGGYANVSWHAGVDSKDSFFGNALGSLVGASLGTKLSGGIKGERDLTHSDQVSQNFSNSKEFTQNNNFNQNLENSLRAIKEQSFRANTDEGQRLTEGLSANYDCAEQASQSFNMHLQEAKAYRDLASFSQDNAASIDVNAQQEFMEWLSHQSMYSNQGPMGMRQAEVLLRSSPDLRASYAERFVQERIAQNLGRWKEDHLSRASVQEAGLHYRDQVASKNRIQNNHMNNKTLVDKVAQSSGISDAEIHINALKNAEHMIEHSKKMIEEQHHTIDSKTGSITDLVRDKIYE
jgi:conjugal transfer mating pair stabilization protein TraG